ncbi:MAG: DeoR/GlpR family DNA-binding transcription regulator [Aeromonas sp.]|jgi:DeoR/GlpR family transcriptional regulator of sugar metabolism
MTQEERLVELSEWIAKEGKVTQELICQRYGISYDSARRDLVKLAQLPGITRIRGGAMRQREHQPGIPYRERSVDAVKARLAKRAASMIQPSDVVLLDTGTTLEALAKALIVPATVVTNSVDILYALSGHSDLRRIMLGGEFDPFNRAIYSREALQQLAGYQADKAFIGVPGLSAQGLSCEKELEAGVKLAMARQAAYRICVCEQSKFNQRFVYQSCGWQDIDCLITDAAPPANILALLEQHDIDLQVVA